MDKKESLETTGLWVEMGKNGKGNLVAWYKFAFAV